MEIDDILKSMECVLEGDCRTFTEPTNGDPKIDLLYKNIHLWYEMLKEYEQRNKYIHIDDVYKLIEGHSNYHGDDILSAFTCLAEGKSIKSINPI